MKTYIMGCTVDGLAFGTAAEGLQHYNGKKHRAKIARHLKDLSQESCAIHIKDASHVPIISILNYFATLGSIQTVHVQHGVGINDTFFHSVVIWYDSEKTATEIRQSRHAVDCIPLGVSRYLVYDDPNRPQTPPPPTSILALDHEFVDKELQNYYKLEKMDLDRQMEALANLIQLRPHELTMRKDACAQIQNNFRFNLNSQCEVAGFGSSVNGLGFQGCDLDVYLYIKHGYPEKKEEETFERWRERCREREKSFVLNAGKLLRDSNQENVSDVAIILSARVPIVKFIHRKTGIKCDLSFKNRMAVLNTEFIRVCLSSDPRIRPLCMVIKYWTYHYKLSGACDKKYGRETILSNYALIIMIFFFLQKEEILPSVKELQDEMTAEESDKIDNWQCGYSKMLLTSSKTAQANRRTISRLIFKFFDFYASFDYKTLVISPFLGRSVTKEVFELPRKCRQTLPSYALNVESGKNASLSTEFPLVVQDPFELNHNLTQAFSADALHVWKRMCSSAKKEFHNDKLYRLFDLKDLPSKLKERLKEKAEPVESENLPASVPEDNLIASEGALPKEIDNAPIELPIVVDADAVDCDDNDRIFIATYIPSECHQSYQDLLEADPNRRMKDKFISLVEIIIDHLLNKTLRFEHVGDDPPPPPLPPGMIPPEADESGEPDKKRARKSRWDPVEEEKPFVDRKRLSELEFLSFYPVWDFRKMARKNCNLVEKILASENAITEKIVENYYYSIPRYQPLVLFKVWAHHSKMYSGSVCVHMMELESRKNVWPVVNKFLREFIPHWTKYVLYHGEVKIESL